ncbi:MAG: ribonuclease HII [Desulfobacterales bacterium]
MREGTDLWSFERKTACLGYDLIAGVDEAGRGPLAGPVISAAVLLPTAFRSDGIDDSKKLSSKRRIELYQRIYDEAFSIGIGIIDSVAIDRINILQASLLAMAMAVDNLDPAPDYLLIDGTFRIPSPLPQNPIPKGDALSVSIAAASIVAKVTRDSMMAAYDAVYPQYGFSAHKGYPTRSHKEAIRLHGCCPIHRLTFKGVRPSGIEDRSLSGGDESTCRRETA